MPNIKSAKKNSDLVIVFTHWGTEYRYSVDASQKKWTNFLLKKNI